MRRRWIAALALSLSASAVLGCAPDEEAGLERVCDDGVDDDRDGLTDCDDQDCRMSTACADPGEGPCDDGRDGDDDGFTDCDDQDCFADPACAGSCGDGVAGGEEACDELDLRDQRCADLGFEGGELSCDGGCSLDATGCIGCGGLDVGRPGVECQPCAEAACCDALAVCHRGTECAALVECAAACDADEGCRAACGRQYPDAVSDATALESCVQSACADECRLGFCGTDLMTTDAGVDACLDASCCAEVEACEADPECAECLRSRGAACSTNTLLSAFDACSTTYCPSKVCGENLTIQTAEGVNIACHLCLNEVCCAEASACVGDGTNQAVLDCIECINEDPGCEVGSAVEAAADAFVACQTANCAAECD